jgi:hypothetical protein
MNESNTPVFSTGRFIPRPFAGFLISAALAASRAQDQGLFLFDAEHPPRRDHGPEVESHAPADSSAGLWQQAIKPVPHPPASRNPRF